MRPRQACAADARSRREAASHSENVSIRALAEMLIEFIKTYPEYNNAASKTNLIEVNAEQYYGSGYQDVLLRVPSIRRAKEYLAWEPKVSLAEGLKKTLDYYLKQTVPA
jgi:nucleoside-diphosphate-sugar epimerase